MDKEENLFMRKNVIRMGKKAFAFLLVAVMALSYLPQVTRAASYENTDVKEFVEGLYTSVLDREADDGGLEYWYKQLVNRNSSGSRVAFGFVFSSEFEARDVSDREFVEIMYITLMGRKSDAGGKAYWVAMLAQGYTRKDVFGCMAGSEEFQKICAGYNINCGNVKDFYPDFSNRDFRRFIQRCYTKILNRSQDKAGMEFWVKQLANGARMANVSYNFVFSPELVNQNLSNGKFITMLYKAILDRDSDQGGYDYWVGRLDRGEARASIFWCFVDSDEFKNLTYNYGEPLPDPLPDPSPSKLVLDTVNKAKYEAEEQKIIESGRLDVSAANYEWYVHDFTYDIPENGIYNEQGRIYFRLFAPQDAVEGEKYPLLIAMHGSGAVGTDNYAQMANRTMAWSFDSWQGKNPSYVLCPQLPMVAERSWEIENRYLLEYTKIIELISDEFGNVDMDRIYSTGFSMGANLSYQIAALRPDFFAGLLIQSGTAVNTTWGDRTEIENLMDIPMYMTHGSIDDAIYGDEAYRVYTELVAKGKKNITLEMLTPEGMDQLNKDIASSGQTGSLVQGVAGHGTYLYAMAAVNSGVDMDKVQRQDGTYYTNCMRWLFEQNKNNTPSKEPILIEWIGADMGNNYKTGTGYLKAGSNVDLVSSDIGYTGNNTGNGEAFIGKFRIPSAGAMVWDASSDPQNTTIVEGDEIYLWMQGFSGLYGDDLAAFNNEWDVDWRILEGSVANIEIVNTHPQALKDKYVGMTWSSGAGPIKTPENTVELYDGQVFIKISLADEIQADENLHIVFHFQTPDGYDYYNFINRKVENVVSGDTGDAGNDDGSSGEDYTLSPDDIGNTGDTYNDDGSSGEDYPPSTDDTSDVSDESTTQAIDIAKKAAEAAKAVVATVRMKNIRNITFPS